ncbi:hypothetical protein BVY04_03455 [bacterium M21]|nr:hypothetical protein BVY04_03455 [bacterium M21]
MGIENVTNMFETITNAVVLDIPRTVRETIPCAQIIGGTKRQLATSEDSPVNTITTLAETADVLLKNGFKTELNTDFVITQIGGEENPFSAILSINNEDKQLLITCKLAVINDFDEDHIAAMALAALDMNTCIRPFAFAIISDTDNPELDDAGKWPLVLTDSMPLGDLCDEDLIATMDALIEAIVASRGVLEIGLGQYLNINTPLEESPMENLIKALSNMIRHKKDQIAGVMTDPVVDGKFAIEDSERQIAEFTTKIARLIAETRKLTKDKETAEEDIARYLTIAKKAAEKGEEEDVRQAVTMKSKAEQRKETLDAEIIKNGKLTDKLRGQLNNARVKVADAKSNLSRLSARMEGAKVRKDLAKASTSFSGETSPLAALDDLQKAVETKESEAEAWEEIAETDESNKGQKLEDKYLGEGDGAVDKEVAALMATASKKKK